MKPFIFKAWFISALRKASYRFPPWYHTLNKTREVYYILSKKGKQLRRVRYECQKCKTKYPKSNIVVDHINPVIDPYKGFPITPDGKEDWNVYISRLFCSEDGLQVLCGPCHDLKTNSEKIIRNSLQKKKKRSKIKKGNNE